MSFIRFDCQYLKWARFGTVADFDSEFLFWFEGEPRRFNCHAFIGFLMGFFIPLWLSTGNSFKSLGKAFVTLMVSKPKRTYVLLI